ncbi:ABC transporter permease [Lactobacillus delbrueckii]|uniref:ABC transporter permease n=1 Tax=Lactobacillus delbrueckii TaxID=1584 RepID=UPI0004A5CB69|nr:ABC transporter permease [Lactobacillus delbrueckii]ALT48415.1 sugar ABC transporter permease [Lactobacillus delbrueckii subsp. bulgaricus]MBT8805390.1 sugar ABC transporter permease [Lactobacillus delbrueckii subsp. bulgaricus]MBT8813543.1 sugar ABC transporter permease [Lactobacillus delbrueckii subsp. bulgaricus]MBT8819766.1 sugar ABC transporter permease [Lactobacillus delbrueckii subsp. bulgaricus]MBT8821172.1 sugar ABC transporter permease [Lactobacillus delbrueckii subsp. bulgaricus]
MNFVTVLALIVSSTLVYSAPLIFTALGGTFSENSGIVNVGLEGIMTMGAFTSIVFNLSFASTFGTATPWLGALLGGIVGIIFSLLHAVATVNCRADHVISGTVLNLMAPPLAVFLVKAIYNKGQTENINQNFGYFSFPGLANIPVIGPIFFKNTSAPAWVAIVLSIFLYWVLYKTRFGLRLRSSGENPQAADTLGINVYKMRYAGVLISGFLGGIGGAVFAEAIAGNFSVSTIAGQGFMALAAMIFGRYNPIGAMLSSLFFGFAQSLSIIGDQLPGISSLPSVYLQIAPYVLTIIVLVVFFGKTVGPAADGQNYIKSK